MSDAENLYHEIASEIPDTNKGKMFGALCIKSENGKAGVMFWKEFMIFKLPEKELKETLSLDGAKIFEPAEGRPMGGWVQLSFDYADKWKELANKSMDYVKSL